jgi:hypothetical protein
MKCTLREWQGKVKDISGMIVQASSINMDDAWQPFPIGMSWQFVKMYHHGEKLQLGSHENLLLCCISNNSDQYRRSNTFNRMAALSILGQNGFYNMALSYTDYFLQLPTYKFVVSPEGNGIDCHRHYEALMAGSIPIVERNPLTEEKYKGCPVLWTTDYSEITQDYLLAKYNEMLDTEYDFSCLFVQNYSPDIQSKLKESGNFWLMNIGETRCIWY